MRLSQKSAPTLPLGFLVPTVVSALITVHWCRQNFARDIPHDELEPPVLGRMTYILGAIDKGLVPWHSLQGK